MKIVMQHRVETPISHEPERLAHAIGVDLAAAPRLLVVCDFDGTISPLVDDPAEATIAAASATALNALSTLPGTVVAVVSGRGLDDLRARLGEHGAWSLVGSHGAEALGCSVSLNADQRATLDALEGELVEIADAFPGAAVERKPRGIAFHFRRADAQAAAGLVQRVLGVGERFAGLHPRRGKCVIEFAVERVTKGDAITSLRAIHTPSRIVFLGDDSTDEDAFAALRSEDVGVKVGDGPTLARFRLADVERASTFLACLWAIRRNPQGGLR
jgi:trehalose-phosphatase